MSALDVTYPHCRCCVWDSPYHVAVHDSPCGRRRCKGNSPEPEHLLELDALLRDQARGGEAE